MPDMIPGKARDFLVRGIRGDEKPYCWGLFAARELLGHEGVGAFVQVVFPVRFHVPDIIANRESPNAAALDLNTRIWDNGVNLYARKGGSSGGKVRYVRRNHDAPQSRGVQPFRAGGAVRGELRRRRGECRRVARQLRA